MAIRSDIREVKLEVVSPILTIIMIIILLSVIAGKPYEISVIIAAILSATEFYYYKNYYPSIEEALSISPIREIEVK